MLDLLAEFKKTRDEIGTKALAERLGITESAVRMISGGHYPNPTKILQRYALNFVDVVPCPFTGNGLGKTECATRSTSPRPMGGNTKQQWWDTCQICKFKGKR